VKTIVFASRNEGKVREIKSMLENRGVIIRSLNDFPNIPEIEEDGDTFFENALKKAKTISLATGEAVLADDSGLEVDYLGGKPGVRSSRYSGNHATDEKNISKLLDQLNGVPEEERGARFKCVLVFYQPGDSFESFEGSLCGRINEKPEGHGGFGYDPVFFIPEKGVTVAQLPLRIKNKISHRAKAVIKLRKWLQKGHLSERTS
jgi:XTP/dITP diphosphohydrolase